MTMEELKKFLEDKNASIKIQGGLTPASLLGIVFIVLKLTGVITWSWWWVLAPFWIPIFVGIVTLIVLYGLIHMMKIKLKNKTKCTCKSINETLESLKSAPKKEPEETPKTEKPKAPVKKTRKPSKKKDNGEGESGKPKTKNA